MSCKKNFIHIGSLLITNRIFYQSPFSLKRGSLIVKNRLFHICAFKLPNLRLPDEKAELFPLYRSFLADDRLHCPEKGLHRHEDGRHYLWSRQLTATKTVVAGKFCAPHGGKVEKAFWYIRDANRLRLQIFDSLKVNPFHIVVVLLFRMTKQSRNIDELPNTWCLLSP